MEELRRKKKKKRDYCRRKQCSRMGDTIGLSDERTVITFTV